MRRRCKLSRDGPTCVAELRSFLGLVNYYRPSIKGYSARASNLLKKKKPWSCTEE